MLQEQELFQVMAHPLLVNLILYFFSLFEEQDDPVAIVNELFEKTICTLQTA
jgi:hypothetical protein